MTKSNTGASTKLFSDLFREDIDKGLFSISPFVETLAQQNKTSNSANTADAAPTYRTVLTEQDFNSTADDTKEAVALSIAQLNYYRAQQYFTILELTVSSQTLTGYIERSKGNVQQLLSLFQSADFLILDSSNLSLVIDTPPKDDNSHLDNQATIQLYKLNSLLIKNTSSASCFYLSREAQALFSQRAEPPSFQDLSALNNQAILSSLIASYMLLGKRGCDAAVLSIASVNQYLKASDNPTNSTSNPAKLIWPCNLEDYPLYNGAINDEQNGSTQLSFPSTDTLSLGLYPVVDSIEWLEKLLATGVKTIQLRIKDLALEQLDIAIAKATALGKQYDARLFINDYWQLAIKHQCYGVHLGQEDLDSTDLKAIQQVGLRLGISTHSEYEWLRAISIKPSYIAMGTVYPTQTKPAILIGLNNLNNWCNTLANHFPIVAIGGIKEHNIDEVLKSGAGSIAVVTAITHADDYKQATERLADKQRPQKHFEYT